MHDSMPYGRIQGQGQGHSREVDRQSPTGLIFSDSALGNCNLINFFYSNCNCKWLFQHVVVVIIDRLLK